MLDWLPWIISGGTITWIVLAIFAPHVLTLLTPILKAVIEGVIELLKRLWDGLLDIVDNINAIIFLIAACLTWGWYIKEEPKVIYKEKTAVSKKVTKPSKVEKPSFSLDGWNWFHK